MDKTDIGHKIKEFRKRRGLTQEELAEAVHMHEKQISRIESGVHFPTFDNFVKILEVLNVTLKDFDIPTKQEEDLRQKAIQIITQADNKDLIFYTPVLEALQKCITQSKNHR